MTDETEPVPPPLDALNPSPESTSGISPESVAPVSPPEITNEAAASVEPPMLPPENPTEPTPPVVAPAPPPAPSPRIEPLTFHGDAREYFRVWIVNTLLTLLTAGVFAAWAKVRKRRYLRGNIELMGNRFDYRANPVRLLIGNVAVAVIFLAYMVVGEVYPWVRFGAFVVGAILLPWVVIRSLSFNAHNTSYRGLRFYFHQTYGMAALTYLAQAVVVIITLGLYYPAWVRNQREFAIGNHRLGDAFFHFQSKSGPFYLAYLVSGAIVIGAAMAGGVVIAMVKAGSRHQMLSFGELIPFFIIYGFGFFVAKQYLFGRLFNQVWNSTRLDGHRFRARLNVGAWLKLQLVNLGAILVSAGLLYPWASIRSARYAVSCLEFEPAGPIEKISRLGKDEGSALGETAGEFMGMDFGL